MAEWQKESASFRRRRRADGPTNDERSGGGPRRCNCQLSSLAELTRQAIAWCIEPKKLKGNYLSAEYSTPGTLLVQPATFAIARIGFNKKEFRFNNHRCSIGETKIP
ncbi:hypothetical protein EVC45_11065 [Paraburkholderia sp. UYCP14C]|uniref:hypothetical protein n=1 Tax=Paraburkholderia sp. UYCP14C TaxID=2511130 RepID=UPI0010217987|nr:hypothetical protein [Paraburkholderia sp. UYCP14C]RZF29725.1 hypothetical protein EVC45_11065 [Paraburkholderia sp. UYCP14C]